MGTCPKNDSLGELPGFAVDSGTLVLLPIFLFSSGSADHALRLGPSMRRSYYKKLLHGHRWSHAAWQIIKPKHKPPKTQGKTQIPSQICVLPSKGQQSKSERGKSPTETTTKDLPRHSGKNSLCRINSKTCIGCAWHKQYGFLCQKGRFVMLFSLQFHVLRPLKPASKACLEACPCSNFHGLGTLESETCIEACL